MRFFLKCYLKQQQQQQQQKSSCALDKDDEYDEDFVDGYMVSCYQPVYLLTFTFTFIAPL